MSRQLLPILLLTLFIVWPSKAQNWTGSVKIGASSASFEGNLASGATTWESILGIAAGGSIGYELTSGFSVAAELLYVRMGAQTPVRYNDFPATLESKITYLSMPLLLQYSLNAGEHFSPRLFAGPAGMFKMDALIAVEDREFGGLLLEEDQSIENIDWGLVFGGGLDFPVSDQTLTVEVRYFGGRMDVTKPTGELDGSELYNRSLTVLVGLLF